MRDSSAVPAGQVEVRFTCKRCGEAGSTCVPGRADPDAIDVVSWLNEVVMPRVGKAHREVSPFCSATTVDLLLPASGEWVGDPR